MVSEPKMPEPVTHGLRRKGTEAIIGVIPNPIAAKAAKSNDYLRDFDEVPLFTADQLQAYAAGIRAEVLGEVRKLVPGMDAGSLSSPEDAAYAQGYNRCQAVTLAALATLENPNE